MYANFLNAGQKMENKQYKQETKSTTPMRRSSPNIYPDFHLLADE